MLDCFVYNTNHCNVPVYNFLTNKDFVLTLIYSYLFNSVVVMSYDLI